MEGGEGRQMQLLLAHIKFGLIFGVAREPGKQPGQTDRERERQTARHAESQHGRHEFHYKRNLRLATVQTGVNQGENQVENVYCENQLLAGSCQLQQTKKAKKKQQEERRTENREEAVETLLKQRKQWAKKLNSKDANEQTRAAKVGSINIEG